MAGTRSKKSSPQSAVRAGTKRAAEPSSSPPAKRGRGRPSKNKKAGEEKVQKTIEETLPGANDEQEAVDETMPDADEVDDDKTVAEEINGKTKENGGSEEVKDEEKSAGNTSTKSNGATNDENKEAEKKNDVDAPTESNGLKDGEKNAFDEVKADKSEVKEAAQQEQEEKSKDIASNNESVVEDEKREATIPSSILEKGIIYFFFRGRVGVEEPQGIEDVARSYIVLRPLPLGAKLGEGPLEDSGNARLLALPKKMLPQSKRDRFLMFVENPKASIKDLREQFSSNEYATKTSGTSHTPAATPFAEGIYAITSTGREAHLAYQITVPEIGDIQKELGVYEKGSYVVSVKNPKAPGPANATLGNPAEYPESIQKKFRELRWSPLEPEMLNYKNTQFLVIGEGLGEMRNAVEEMSKDKKDDEKVAPEEEVEKLVEEDHDRVDNLKEDDPVFADLGLSSKEYPKIQTTW